MPSKRTKLVPVAQLDADALLDEFRDVRTRLRVKAAKKATAKLVRAGKPFRSPKPPEGYTMSDTAMSFEEWKESGFMVRRGMKSETSDILGVPQFLLNQVFKTSWTPK